MHFTLQRSQVHHSFWSFHRFIIGYVCTVIISNLHSLSSMKFKKKKKITTTENAFDNIVYFNSTNDYKKDTALCIITSGLEIM